MTWQFDCFSDNKSQKFRFFSFPIFITLFLLVFCRSYASSVEDESLNHQSVTPPVTGCLNLRVGHQQTSIMRGLGYVDFKFVTEGGETVGHTKINVHSRKIKLAPPLVPRGTFVYKPCVAPKHEVTIQLSKDLLNQPVWLQAAFLTESVQFHCKIDKITKQKMFWVRHDRWLGLKPKKLFRFDQLELKKQISALEAQDQDIDLHLSMVWNMKDEYPEITLSED